MGENDYSVEIGPGTEPTLQYLREDLKSGKPMYIERDESSVEELSKKMEAEGNESQVIRGDVSDIKLPENSADSILLKDVFSQQGIPARGNLAELVDIGDMDHIIDELNRVCKEDGKVVVLDTGTPLNRGDLIKKFQAHGFDINEYAGRKESYGKRDIHRIFDDTNEVARITGNAIGQTASQEGYALVFRKMA